MERKIMNELTKWRIDMQKKPILLYGVSGCGKTYTVLEFGKKEYKNTIYFDCANNLELNYVFDKNTTLDKLIRGLSAISLETIFQEETLLIFDNVSLKIFQAVQKLFGMNSSYSVIMITNSFSFVSKMKGSGFVLRKMHLVDFSEYLRFLGKDQMIDFIMDSFRNNKPMPFHTLAMEMFHDFLLTGGYPSAIVGFHENKDFNLLSSIHEKNVKFVRNRLFELDNLIDIKRGDEVLQNMSFQLLKDHKKFLYGFMHSGARAKEYERVIQFMEEDGLVIKSERVGDLTLPLRDKKDADSFKLYYHDSGILFKKMNIGANRLLTDDRLLSVLYENHVAATLNQNGFHLYHYHSGGKAFIDFVIQSRNGKIIPIELLKNGDNAKSKSLALAFSKYDLSFAIRFGEENFKEKKGVKYVPYYAAFCVTEAL